MFTTETVLYKYLFIIYNSAIGLWRYGFHEQSGQLADIHDFCYKHGPRHLNHTFVLTSHIFFL